MRIFGLCCLSFFLLPGICAVAQQPGPTPAAAAAKTPAPAYDTAALPKNKKDAWEMLQAANGLHGRQIKPWIATGEYKLFGPDGKVSVSGHLEIVWAAPDRWRNTFTDAGVSSKEWRTPDGAYVDMGKPEGLAYPREMLPDVILDPVESSLSHNQLPKSLAKKKVLGVELSCFENWDPGIGAPGKGSLMDHGLFCAAPDRPILRIAEQDYAIFVNNVGLFQGQFLGREVIVRGPGGTLFELDMNRLALASAQQLQTLDPPKGLKPTGWVTLALDRNEYDAAAEPIHRLKAPEPFYPESMKNQRVQGSVRLAAVIGVDGSLTVEKVLYSTDPAFTRSAEEAVSQWKYEPYLLHDKPVAVHIQIVMDYRLGH